MDPKKYNECASSNRTVAENHYLFSLGIVRENCTKYLNQKHTYRGGRLQGLARGQARNLFFLQKWTGQDRTGDTFLVIFRRGQNYFLGFFDFY